MGCLARLMDAADAVLELPDAYPVPRLRPPYLQHLGLTCYAVWPDPDGVWVFRCTERRWPETPVWVTVIAPDDRERVMRREHVPATAVLWTVRDQQGRVVYREGVDA